jgi:hypothetical protein
MQSAWELIHDLLGGTRAMRAAGEKWLPIEPMETKVAYNARLNRTVLFGAYEDTVNGLVVRPFSKGVSLSKPEGLHEQLAAIADNVDLEGAALTQFIAQAFRHAINYGIHHILVDYPKVTGQVTLADQRGSGIRPFWIHVTAPNLIGWSVERDPMSGSRRLTEIRIQETVTVSLSDFKQEKRKRIRVIRPKAWELWEQITEGVTKDTWIKIEDGVNTLGKIPLVTIYFDQTSGFMLGTPVLERLAWMNLEHWQSSSDQRNILRVARVGILFASGFREDELPTLVIGPNFAIRTDNAEANLRYVEHTGSAIGAGRDDLRDLELRMEIFGLKPLMENVAQSTATGNIIAEAKPETTIQYWIRTAEEAFLKCYQLSAEWVGAELPKDFDIDIYNDFGITGRPASDIDNLLKMRAATPTPLITHSTALTEIKRRGLLRDEFDVEQEVADVADEVGAITADDTAPTDAEEDIDEEDVVEE